MLHLIRAGRDPGTGECWDDHLVLSPIIAWEIERRGEPYSPRSGMPAGARYTWHKVTPITDVYADDSIDHIKRPDGSFNCAQTTMNNEQEAIGYIKELEDAAEEARQ